MSRFLPPQSTCDAKRQGSPSRHQNVDEQSDGPKRAIGRFLMENLLAPARSSGAFGHKQNNAEIGGPVQTPDFQKIRRERASGRCDCSSYARRVHPDKRAYKYYWWVFWSESQVDGDEFLTDKYRLSTAAAKALLAELKARGEPTWLYNCRLPRRDPANPFDTNHPRWRDAEWAPGYDDDSDPVAPESGHK